jgi:V/A-type H+-transporting ATPase subunit I
MIVQMKKYAFMVYHKEYEQFLHTLREAGVVHVKENRSISGNAELQELLEIRKQLKTSLEFLCMLNNETKTEDFAPAHQITKEKGLYLIGEIERLKEKRVQLRTEELQLQKDIDYMQIWGDFSYGTIEKLREAGYEVGFFSCPTSKFDTKWREDYNAILVNYHQFVSYFVTVTKVGETVEIEAERAKMPHSGLDMLNATSVHIKESIRHLDDQMKEFAASTCNTLGAFDKSLQNEFNFNKVAIQSERKADDRVVFIEGWTTAEKANDMEALFDKQGYFYQELQIEPKDKVPIQLKNNRYARLFEPLTKMFSLPNYTELDPTPLLAPFFMLFFGLCFGDAGYGLLVFLAGTFLKKRVSLDVKPFLTLAQWLGGTTMVIGLLVTGSFFGIALVDVPALEPVKAFFLSRDRQMQLALALGMFHVVYGKAVAASKIKKQRGLKYSLAPWAWVFIITPLLIIFAPSILSMFGEPLDIPPLPQTVTYICYGVAIVSALVAFLYNTPGKNVFINIGSAIWGTYNVASGMLGDTLSYIRLFAIGLTGGILGGVFNMLGVGMTVDLPVVVRIPVMLIILLIGHGMNIALCTIASLVHPIRLIFVEYFKNSEYEGGGVAYEPFRKV